MPVLSFPCVVHRLHPFAKQVTHHRTWIKGHDLRALALAATAQLGSTVEQCTYALIQPGAKHAQVLLEVSHADGDALVGPMAGPVPGPSFSLGRKYSLDELLASLGFADAPEGRARIHADGPCPLVVIVAYASIWQSAKQPPARQGRESDRQYAVRRQEAERIRVERTRHQGIHLVTYDVPPREWTAYDLDMVMGLAYRLLPTAEPRWREVGAITQARFAAAGHTGQVTVNYCLEVGRGEFVAYVRLPVFPTRAVAEWLADRRCDISLRHPVMKLELIQRGWRCKRPADNTSAGAGEAHAPVLARK